MKTILQWCGILNLMVVFGALMTFRWDNVPIMIMCGIIAALCFWRS